MNQPKKHARAKSMSQYDTIKSTINMVPTTRYSFNTVILSEMRKVVNHDFHDFISKFNDDFKIVPIHSRRAPVIIHAPMIQNVHHNTYSLPLKLRMRKYGASAG